MPGLESMMERLFGTNGPLATRMGSAFEPRSSQLAMARAIARLLEDEATSRVGQPKPACMLAVEAETGTGKTLAYLVPAALSGQKVIVSTATLTLQDQIIGREIPFLQKTIAPELTALCIKGRQNYLCLRRFRQFQAAPLLAPLRDDAAMERLEAWLEETELGDRAELEWLPDRSSLWDEIGSSTTNCLGAKCPEQNACFITALRRKAARSQLLVVNHHLFFSDLAIRRLGHAEVLPRYESVIFDEAHHLENVATQYFGFSFSQYQVLDLAGDIEAMPAEALSGSNRLKAVQLARHLMGDVQGLGSILPADRGRHDLLALIDRAPGWSMTADRLAATLQSLASHLESVASLHESWGAVARRSRELGTNFEAIATSRARETVYWFERRDRTFTLTASPVNVAAELHEHLYRQTRALVFTSATLATGGSFRYFIDRLGLPPDLGTLTLASPFDYASRTLLYVPPNDFPPPAAPGYPDALADTIRQILLVSRGRALVLFTSHQNMNAVHAALAGSLPYPTLVQGQAPRSRLLKTFQEQTDSVLLAVASFWEGVDVPGEALSCVIIDKLPFEVPSDPVMMARMKKIEEEGGNPFVDFQIPRAILALRQGLGRLMRSRTDRGALAILDPRLFTKSYGKAFRNSLPPSPVTRDLDDLVSFFQQERA